MALTQMTPLEPMTARLNIGATLRVIGATKMAPSGANVGAMKQNGDNKKCGWRHAVHGANGATLGDNPYPFPIFLLENVHFLTIPPTVTRSSVAHLQHTYCYRLHTCYTHISSLRKY